jgi:hypothetical protein
MEDERRVTQRIGHCRASCRTCSRRSSASGRGALRADAVRRVGKNFKSRFDLEATLAALHREAFLWQVKDKRWATFDSPCWAVPGELVECVRLSPSPSAPAAG